MLSFAVTAYNELSEPQQHGQRILDCISAAQHHPAIDEIIVVDDGSEDYPELSALLANQPKVSLHHYYPNRGVFTNKIEAVALASNNWVINSDSDNLMDTAYIDHVISMKRDPLTWYCPSFAKPQFDYRGLVGRYDIDTIKDFFQTPIAACAINTGNEIVYRPEYMRVLGRFHGVRRFDLILPNYLGLQEEERLEEQWHLVYGACDSILLNMEWLKAGGTLEFCEGLEYEHAVHVDKSGSNYDRAPAAKELLAAILRQRLVEGA